jgi:adenylate cyclase
MLALWATAGPDQGTRAAACRAALEIMGKIGLPGASDAYLPTRIGLHCGEVVLGNVGAGEHFEYRAVGDIVNTAQRIEDLNKRLGTRVLASDEVLEGLALDPASTREIGRFCLCGKSRPLTLHQLCLPGGEPPERSERRHMVFAAGLSAFRIRDLGQAAQIFEGLLAELGEDGPARFYLALCRQYQKASPLAPWDGTVNLDEVPGRLT